VASSGAVRKLELDAAESADTCAQGPEQGRRVVGVSHCLDKDRTDFRSYTLIATYGGSTDCNASTSPGEGLTVAKPS
jgi:hypothetical protein